MNYTDCEVVDCYDGFVLISPVSLYGSIFLIPTLIHQFPLLCRLLTEIFFGSKENAVQCTEKYVY